MAENIVLPIFLLGILLLLSKTSKKNILLASIIPALLYSAKYAFIPIAIMYCFLYVLKIYLETRKKKTLLLERSAIYILLLGMFFSFIFLYGYVVNKFNPFSGVMGLIWSFFPNKYSGPSVVKQVSNPWMSFQYVKLNLPQYLYSLIGKSARFLWDFTPIVSNWIGAIGILGLVVGLCRSLQCGRVPPL